MTYAHSIEPKLKFVRGAVFAKLCRPLRSRGETYRFWLGSRRSRRRPRLRPHPRCCHTIPCLHNRDNSLARNVFISQDIFIWDIIWVVSNFGDLDLIFKVTSSHFVFWFICTIEEICMELLSYLVILCYMEVPWPY